MHHAASKVPALFHVVATTIYVVFDICIEKESIVLIFRRDILYFHHGQRCDDTKVNHSHLQLDNYRCVFSIIVIATASMIRYIGRR